jgi:hypothetical protein
MPGNIRDACKATARSLKKGRQPLNTYFRLPHRHIAAQDFYVPLVLVFIFDDQIEPFKFNEVPDESCRGEPGVFLRQNTGTHNKIIGSISFVHRELKGKCSLPFNNNAGLACSLFAVEKIIDEFMPCHFQKIHLNNIENTLQPVPESKNSILDETGQVSCPVT